MPYPNHFRTYHIKHGFTTPTAPLAGGIATYIHTKHYIYENKKYTKQFKVLSNTITKTEKPSFIQIQQQQPILKWAVLTQIQN